MCFSLQCAGLGTRLLGPRLPHQLAQAPYQLPCLQPMRVPRVWSASCCHSLGPLRRPAIRVAASPTGKPGEPDRSGSPGGGQDAVQQQLAHLTRKVADVAAEQEVAYSELKEALQAANYNPKVIDALQKRYDDLTAEKASLNEMCKNLLAKLPGAGDDGRLYSEVTLYVLSLGRKGYSTLRKQRTTRKQLQGMWDKYGYDLVTPVNSKPAQLLTIDTCPDCTDMGSVRLEDGVHLAVVMHQPLTFMGLLQDKVTENTNLAEEVHGFKNNVVAEQENAAAAWALEQIRTEPGAQVFCIKEVAKAVELDGAACSDVSAIIVIVERKQTFRHSDLEEFVTKLDKLRKLIELGAANTELLQGKKLRAYVMAGSWSGSTDEQAAMVRLMNEHHIESVMPNGSAYQISWGCNPHRPGAAASTETEACAQRFLTVRDRVKSAQPAMLHQGQVGQAML